MEATEEQQREIPPIIGEETVTGVQEASVLTTIYAPIPPDTRMLLPDTPPPTPAPVNYQTTPPQNSLNQEAPLPTNPPIAVPLVSPTNPPVTPPSTNSGVTPPGAVPVTPSTWAPITPAPTDQPATNEP